MVAVSLHGPFQVRGTDGEIIRFEARSAAFLLARLTVARGQRVSRDVLARDLWPETPREVAKTNLRKALQRLRSELPEAVEAEADTLQLRTDLVQSDLDQADHGHRSYLLAARLPDGVRALQDEWAIRARPFLEGWDAAWILEERERRQTSAHELAIELARAHEAIGDLASALAVWRQLLTEVPNHFEAIPNAIRLELQLHGKAEAASLAEISHRALADASGFEIPRPIRRLLREVRAGTYEPVPPPDHLRKRSELHLLARMFEANLDRNREEALNLLAAECTMDEAMAHPAAMLGLLTLALERTTGASVARIRLASLAVLMASLASQFDVGHRWADEVLALTQEADPNYANVLSMKGFMQFEQREYETARVTIEHAIAIHHQHGREDEAARAGIRLAGLDWHILNFDQAAEGYHRALARSDHREEDELHRMRLSANSNLCFLHVMRREWSVAKAYGESVLRESQDQPAYETIVSAPLALATYFCGNRPEGVRLAQRAIAVTQREGMLRFNQIALDFAAIILHAEGQVLAARGVLGATAMLRASIRHQRSPAEQGLVDSLVVETPEFPERNPLRGQSAASLSDWMCEALARQLAT